MSDEPQVLRTIDWRTVFPFTQLFRAFRIAIHPAKLILALLAITAIYSLGRALDSVWPKNYMAVPGEVTIYEGAQTKAAFNTAVAEQRTRIYDQRRAMLSEARLTPTGATLRADEVPSIDRLRKALAEFREGRVKAANDKYKGSSGGSDNAKIRDNEITQAYADAAEEAAQLKSLETYGLGLTFLEYEAARVDDVAQGILKWNWFTEAGAAGPAVMPNLYRFVFTGPGWAISKHPIYFIPMTIITLLVWSVIGGAIARLAAVHVAQDEKISVRHALRFSTNKLMSFFAAPIMPLLLVGIVALILALIGWLSEIIVLGPIVSVLVGALFVVFIGVGVLVACALVGTVCGFGLMYPTIAVEGSDAFDAVSRSFSYVFARPWKIVVYSVIALVYAALTYVFLRFMCYLTLSVLHNFLTLWTSHNVPDGHTSLATSWPAPRGLFDLVPPYDGFNLTFAGGLTYGLLIFWVYLFVGLLGAYLLSYFVSVNTIMYYLLRWDVDATELDDVYLEPSDDDDFDTTAAGGDPIAPLGAATAASASGATGTTAAPAVPAATTSSPAPSVMATIAAAGAANAGGAGNVATPGAAMEHVAGATPPPPAASPAVIEPAIAPPASLTPAPNDAPPPPVEKPHGDPVDPNRS